MKNAINSIDSIIKSLCNNNSDSVIYLQEVI